MTKMTFSGVSLVRLRYALELALDELHNQIATCPDPARYEEDIAELEEEQAHIRRIVARIDKRMEVSNASRRT